MTLEERNQLVEDNLKLISYSLNLLKVQWNEDYFQQGVLELIRCAENYDETKGYKFSTYATKCISLKLKDYIKRDFVIKPKLTGEGGGKVYGPPTIPFNAIMHENPGDKPILLEDILAADINWDFIDLRIELDNLIQKGILTKEELQLFIDCTVNKYPYRYLTNKYQMKKNMINSEICRIKSLLKDNISYNYYEGGS